MWHRALFIVGPSCLARVYRNKWMTDSTGIKLGGKRFLTVGTLQGLFRKICPQMLYEEHFWNARDSRWRFGESLSLRPTANESLVPFSSFPAGCVVCSMINGVNLNLWRHHRSGWQRPILLSLTVVVVGACCGSGKCTGIQHGHAEGVWVRFPLILKRLVMLRAKIINWHRKIYSLKLHM